MTIFNYTVNGIDVAFAVIMILSAVICYRRGFVVNLLGFIKWSVGLFLCFFVSSYYSQSVYDTFVKPRALEYINQKIVTSSNVDEILANLNTMQAHMPKLFAQFFDFSNLKLSSGDISQSLLENVFQPALISITKIVLFIAVFIVFFTVMGLIILAVQRHNKKKDREGDSKLRTADKILGLLLGIIKGAIVIFAIASVICLTAELFEDNSQHAEFVKYVGGSELIKIIKEINPFNALTEGILI